MIKLKNNNIVIVIYHCTFNYRIFSRMASTRNRNTCSNYCLEQRITTKSLEYNEFKNGASGAAYAPALPCMGIIPGQMPREAFSHNSIDIESALFGINSTNLVETQKPVVPQLKTLPNVSFFGRMQLVMPDPLVVEKFQRPFPVPN
jgi:hypothetical protein